MFSLYNGQPAYRPQVFCARCVLSSIALALFALSTACSDGSATTPSSGVSNIAGTLVGTFFDTRQGNNPTTWLVQQSGKNFTGTFTINTSFAVGHGTVQGTVNGTSSVNWSGSISAGGYPAPYQACAQSANGTTTIKDASNALLTLQGNYSLNTGAGCPGGAVASTGTLVLTK